MKDLEKNAGMQEMSMAEMMDVNGGWNWKMAVGAAAAVSCLGPQAALIGFVAGGLFL